VNPTSVVSINRADVTYEVFDDEVVLINFRSGSYFSVGGSGRDIVQGLAVREMAIEDLLRLVESRSTGDAPAMAAAIESFLADLEREGLVSVLDALPGSAGAGPTPGTGPATTSAAVERCPFEPPILRAYDDMQALLLLDPIHEVDESGWPSVKPAPPGPRK
jgi:hypothetical protein